MRRFLPYIAGIMAYAMAPGASEAVESALQLMVEGPVAQASSDAEHETQDEESGCSGTFHVCQCHSSLSFLTGTMAPEVETAPEHRQNVYWDVVDLRAEGCRGDMFRPPAA